jgi:hypothetical protein
MLSRWLKVEDGAGAKARFFPVFLNGKTENIDSREEPSVIHGHPPSASHHHT